MKRKNRKRDRKKKKREKGKKEEIDEFCLSQTLSTEKNPKISLKTVKEMLKKTLRIFLKSQGGPWACTGGGGHGGSCPPPGKSIFFVNFCKINLFYDININFLVS